MKIRSNETMSELPKPLPTNRERVADRPQQGVAATGKQALEPQQTRHRLLAVPLASPEAVATNHDLSNGLRAHLATQRAMGVVGAYQRPGTIPNDIPTTRGRPLELRRIDGTPSEGSSSPVGSIAAGAVAIGAGALAFTSSSAFETARNTVGVAGAGKYSFQAIRAAKGLATTTKATVALDLLGGSLGMGSAAGAEAAGVGAEVAKGLATEAKGVAGAAKLSGMAKVSNIASKAAPVIAKGAAVVGVGVGAYGIYDGVQALRSGDEEEGREKIVSGTADVVSSAALGVAAVSSGTVVGLPVAAVALGVAGVSQAAKYAYKFSDEITSGASWVANKVGDLWD